MKSTDDELLDVSMTALGYLVKFGTGIIIHKEEASYIIHNELVDDEMYTLTTTKYLKDDKEAEIFEYEEGQIVEMLMSDDEDQKPKLTLVE